MAEMPERWQEAYSEWRLHSVVPRVIVELGTAEARIRELEVACKEIAEELAEAKKRIEYCEVCGWCKCSREDQ